MTFKVDGLEQLKISVKILGSKSPAFVQKALTAFGNKTQRKLSRKHYPAELPNQEYIRRYQYGGLQGSFVTGRVDEDTIFIGNTMEAAGYVIGENQADIHEGRWWQLQPYVIGELDELLIEIGGEAERIW